MTFTIIKYCLKGFGLVRNLLNKGKVASGGQAAAFGNNCTAVGGNGGNSTENAVGGPGGNAFSFGKDCFASGGDGGNVGRDDGRGGRRTKSPGEKLNLPTNLWGYGYGGVGANHHEYDRRLQLLITLRLEYVRTFPCDANFINAGIDQVPINWVNKRLEELGESWKVEMIDGSYKMPKLFQKSKQFDEVV